MTTSYRGLWFNEAAAEVDKSLESAASVTRFGLILKVFSFKFNFKK